MITKALTYFDPSNKLQSHAFSLYNLRLGADVKLNPMNLFKKIFSRSQEEEVKPWDKYQIIQTPEEFMNDALRLYHMFALEEAMIEVDECIDQHPDYADAYSLRGSIHMALGNSKEACKDWRACIKLGGDAEPLISKYCKK